MSGVELEGGVSAADIDVQRETAADTPGVWVPRYDGEGFIGHTLTPLIPGVAIEFPDTLGQNGDTPI